MEKVNKLESEKNLRKILISLFSILVIISICLAVYNIFKTGILSFENGKLTYNEYKVPIYGWAKQIKDLEK